jgi:hypothetical protein
MLNGILVQIKPEQVEAGSRAVEAQAILLRNLNALKVRHRQLAVVETVCHS